MRARTENGNDVVLVPMEEHGKPVVQVDLVHPKAGRIVFTSAKYGERGGRMGILGYIREGVVCVTVSREDFEKVLGEARTAREKRLDIIRKGEVPIEAVFYEGEILSGWRLRGDAAFLCKEAGIAHYVGGWGVLLDSNAYIALGSKFTFPQVELYIAPARKEKAEKLKRNEIERAKFRVDVLEKGSVQNEELDPYAKVRVTDASGESGVFICRNIFDFGFVINHPEGGIPRKADGTEMWYWDRIEREPVWMSDFEVRAVEYLQRFPPISKQVRM
jgi:hypothetical protein